MADDDTHIVYRLNEDWNWESVSGLSALSEGDYFCMTDRNGQVIEDHNGHVAWVVTKSTDYTDDENTVMTHSVHIVGQ